METKAKFLTTKQMTLIALMTALTCILGPLSIPLPFSPCRFHLQTWCCISRFLYWEQIQHHQLYRIPLDRSGRTSGIFRFQWRSGKSGRAYGRISGRIVFLTVIAGFLWSILKGNCHLPFWNGTWNDSYVILFGTIWLSMAS